MNLSNLENVATIKEAQAAAIRRIQGILGDLENKANALDLDGEQMVQEVIDVISEN